LGKNIKKIPGRPEAMKGFIARNNGGLGEAKSRVNVPGGERTGVRGGTH